MAPNYFYVDAARQQAGPVTAAAMSDLFKSGSVDKQTLCFADDGSLPTWTALADVPALM